MSVKSKNIHVLPTDKPSRIYLNTGEWFFENNYSLSVDECINQHIYITSDEEIKEDYVIVYGVVIKVMIFDKETLYFVNGTKAKREDCKKIILTTDVDLIKYGVQVIDDEFLEWFVKNPSCEEVGFSTYHVKGDISGKLHYQIIIPKEEAKQDLEKEMFELEQELDIPSHLRWHNSKPKQETLEEVAERLFPINTGDESLDYQNKVRKPNWISGAKWQQERMYSEEDMRISFDANIKDWISFEEFIEQFKNK